MHKTNRRMIAAAIVSTIALTTLSLPAGVAAHAALARSNPAAGATLAEPPVELRLEFTEPLEPAFTGADLLDASGAAVPGISVSIAPENDRHLIVVPPPGLPDGAYTVAWRNLSAADGHTLQGYFGFRIGEEGSVGEAAFAAPAASGSESVRALTRGLALIGLAALLAIAPVTLIVLRPAQRAVGSLSATSLPFLRRYTVLAAALALLGSLAALVAQAMAVVPDTALVTAVMRTIGETRYGQLWLLRAALILLAIALAAFAFWGRQRWRQPALLAGTALAAIMPWPFSLLSHAAAQQEGRAAAVAADALHLLMASVWSGGLFLLALVLVPALRSLPADERRAAWRTAIPRFSMIGLAAWGVLLLSGLYSAWLHVGTVAALRDTSYGQSLLLKLALLVPVLALAAFHFALGKSSLHGRGANRISLTVGAEALLVFAVLLVVGRLIGLEPAREIMAARTPTQLVVPLAFATDEGIRAGTLAISPGTPGVNIFSLEVEGSPLPEGAEGVLRFNLPAQAIGAQELRLPASGPNRFQAEGSELALPGEWQVEAIVRAIGAFSWSSDITVPLAQTPPTAPEPNPPPHFAPAAIVGMIAIAIGVAGLAVAVAATGAFSLRRLGIAATGAVAVAIGGAIAFGSRLAPVPLEPAPVVAQRAPD
ncbi:MAG: copper resistance protein CopC, partial [Thermomicrobiales bacterium]